MTHLEIESDLFVALGCLIAGERSELSPLPIFNTGLVSPEQHQRLLQSGLLEETDAAPTGELNLMLEALRTALSSASLLITTQDGQNEYQIYYPPDGFSPVIMMLDQNKIIISCAGNAEEEIIASLNNLPNPAPEGTASFSCRLPAIEAESLAVIIDLNRQASSQFTDQAGSSPHANPALTYNANQIYQASLTRMDSSPDMWLFSILFSMFVFGEERTFPKIEQALLGLVAAGLVESKEQGYLLSNQVAKYTRSFSKPQGALILNVSYQPGDAPVRTESLAIFTAGEGSLVLLSTSDESLLVNPFPPARVLEIATQALRKPITFGDSIHEEATGPANNEIIEPSSELEYQHFPAGDPRRLGREADNDLTLTDEKASQRDVILQRQGIQGDEPPQPESPESQSAPISPVPVPQSNVTDAELSLDATPTILSSQAMPQKPPVQQPAPYSGDELLLSEQPDNENLNQWQCACGSKNAGLFCPICGSQKPTPVVVKKSAPVQPTVCRQCGEALSTGARFCRNCGTET